MILLQGLVVMMFLKVELEMIALQVVPDDDTSTGNGGDDTFNVDSGTDTVTDYSPRR